MGSFGFILKVVIMSILSCGWMGNALGLARPFSTPEMRTHLVSVDYNPYGYQPNNYAKTSDDTLGQESIKIENRQFYDTVKHPSGYDPDLNTNSTRPSKEEPNDKQNTSSINIFNAPRKSAVIQAIPRKIRGPGSPSTTTSSPYARHSSLHASVKDYGTGEPTTTIVYATSIPTTSSRTYVNIRPEPLLPTQKYRSTLSDDKQQKTETTETPKPVLEHFFEEEKQNQQQEQQKSQLNVVLEKPVFRGDSRSDQGTTTPRSYGEVPTHIEQRKKSLYKNIPHSRIRPTEEVDKIAAYNQNSFVNLYRNHKWSSDDFATRMVHSLPSVAPASQRFVYESMQDVQQNFYQPPPTNQHGFTPRYPAADGYNDEVYRSIMHLAPMYAPQQQDQHQTYQPLTVRDFELLLQLLVLRERRLNGVQDPYSSPSLYPRGGGEENFFGPAMSSSGYFKNRESGLTRTGTSAVQSSVRLLPPNVREELLYRMLLLALHMQPQPKPVSRSLPFLPQQYTFFSSSATTPPSPSQFDFRQHSGSIAKNPIRSVQVLGEID